MSVVNIPTHILELSEKSLKKYIDISLKIDKNKSRLGEIEANITRLMISIEELIGDFIPIKKEKVYMSYYDDNEKYHPYSMNLMMSNIDRDKNVFNSFLGVEEISKQVRPLLLEKKALNNEIKYLENQLKLIK